MTLLAKKNTEDFEPIEEGVHVGVIINVIDLGTQRNEKFDSEARKVLITWELPNETINIDGEEKPRVISKMYTLSLHEKARLRGDLETIRLRKFSSEEIENGFDIFQMIGSNCQLQVEHNDRGYANIVSVMALPKGTMELEATNPAKTFEIEQEDVPEGLPSWIQDIIKKSKEYNMKAN